MVETCSAKVTPREAKRRPASSMTGSASNEPGNGASPSERDDEIEAAAVDHRARQRPEYLAGEHVVGVDRRGQHRVVRLLEVQAHEDVVGDLVARAVHRRDADQARCEELDVRHAAHLLDVARRRRCRRRQDRTPARRSSAGCSASRCARTSRRCARQTAAACGPRRSCVASRLRAGECEEDVLERRRAHDQQPALSRLAWPHALDERRRVVEWKRSRPPARSRSARDGDAVEQRRLFVRAAVDLERLAREVRSISSRGEPSAISGRPRRCRRGRRAARPRPCSAW